MTRNLLQYPITEDEVLTLLKDLEERSYGIPKSIGGLHSYILNCLAKVVDRDFKPEDYAIKEK